MKVGTEFKFLNICLVLFFRYKLHLPSALCPSMCTPDNRSVVCIIFKENVCGWVWRGLCVEVRGRLGESVGVTRTCVYLSTGK